MTESVSRIKIIHTIISIASVFVSIAMRPRFAPSARLQTSPIKNFAGFILNHKKAISAPQILTHRVERRKSHWS
jgi:hypothetical protein